MALAAMIFFGCTPQNNEEARQLIIGQWKYDTKAILEDVAQRKVSDQERAVVQGVMAVYQDAIFDFQADSTLLVMSNGIYQYGNWKLSKNGKSLYLNLSGQDQPNTIQELNPNHIILSPDPQRGIPYTRIFIPAGGQ